MKGWHSRGYLPHFDANVCQFVTFHLHDSMPQHVLKRFREEIDAGKFADRDREFRLRIENYLDAGIGRCMLREPEIAEVVENALLFRDGERYHLRAWVLMPNHGHILLRTDLGHSLSTIMRDIKGFTSRSINKLIGETGPIWQPDYFDRYIRDGKHFSTALRYIENNPVMAGLAERAEDWRFGSAWWRANGTRTS